LLPYGSVGDGPVCDIRLPLWLLLLPPTYGIADPGVVADERDKLLTLLLEIFKKHIKITFWTIFCHYFQIRT
jgi:hypothetical protein